MTNTPIAILTLQSTFLIWANQILTTVQIRSPQKRGITNKKRSGRQSCEFSFFPFVILVYIRTFFSKKILIIKNLVHFWLPPPNNNKL